MTLDGMSKHKNSTSNLFIFRPTSFNQVFWKFQVSKIRHGSFGGVNV